MVSPAAPVLTAEPERPVPPVRDRTGLLVVALGVLTALCAVAFPFAPVTQPQVSYSWRAADGAAAIPLMPYQPVSLTVTTSCDAVRAGGTLLSTVPPRPDPTAYPLYGLRLTGGGSLAVTSAGVDLGTVPLPAGPCTVVLTSDPRSTAVTVDGRPVLTRDGDVRPDVAGAFSDAATGTGAGTAMTLVADTRFQTSITPLKAGIAAVGVLALLGLLLVLGRADARHGRRARLLPRGWGRPRAPDLVVAAVLGVWWVVGALTVDDGYIAGIVRSRGENGFVGNVYRWLNAPESPFSWFYDLLYGWSQISPSTVWMRLPATLLGLLCWALLSRGLLPRILGGRGTWLAACAFLIWWVPLNVGLRPEPWVAVGLLGTTLAVERAIATRRLRPLAAGLVIAGATTALTPGGLVAFAPYLAAAVPVLRLLRARRDVPVAVLIAAPASAVFLMLDDQSLAGMLESVRVRGIIGGGLPWYGEYERYANLLSPVDFQGSIGRRAAVLATLLAVAGVIWAVRRRTPGIVRAPAARLAVALLLALAIMTFTPTKWTQHFGDLAGTGAALMAVAGVAFARARLRPRVLTASLAAVTVVAALVLAGTNSWPFVSAWFRPTFSTLPPQVESVLATTVVLVAGLVLVAVLLARSLWARSGGHAEPAVPRWMPGPVPVMVVLLVGVLVLQVGGLGRTALAHRDSYTLASDAVATAGGDPCGLQRELSVETDPAAGLLTARTEPATATEIPVDIGGTTLPGIGVAGRATTAWFALDPAQMSGRLPVVVTTAGSLRAGDRVTLQFGTGGDVVGTSPVTTSGTRDVRVLAPAAADSVRLAVDASTAGSSPPALVTLPRVPRLTPMETLLPRGTDAILDWPIAFVFPCLNPEPLPLGTAGLAQWRVGPPQAEPSAGITYAPGFGGPFATARLLVTERRMPTYLAGDPIRDAVQLYRWTPVTPLASPRPSVVDITVPGWAADGRARVPGLDPVGQ